MAAAFKYLSKAQQAAVTAYVNRELERVISENPTSYLAQNAQSDPEGWRKRLRELIAPDEKRVATIVRAEEMRGIRPPLGFTLIELSIVLVIIGLIVGGVLVGQDLIRAAAVRAQITQIEKFDTAASTFREKYGYLPGDIKDPDASNFGFAPRGTLSGQGDGNGILQGNYNGNCSSGVAEGVGENVMFWVDLQEAGLISGHYHGTPNSWSGGSASQFFPPAILGSSSYVLVFNSSWTGANYFGLQGMGDGGMDGCDTGASFTLTVQQAYAIDTKVDDGFPDKGNVLATFVSTNDLWWDQPSTSWGGGMTGPATMGGYGTPGTSSTCFDNRNVPFAPMQYSLEMSNGSNVDCTLSFKIQAGD